MQGQSILLNFDLLNYEYNETNSKDASNNSTAIVSLITISSLIVGKGSDW